MRKILVFTVLACIVTGCTATNSAQSTTGSSTQFTKEITEDGFHAVLTYQGNDTWNYAVNGSVASPCHEIKILPMVNENNSEQIVLNLTVRQPSADKVCAQVITEKRVEGSFNATASTVVELDVK